jgi:hypothetical protein
MVREFGAYLVNATGLNPVTRFKMSLFAAYYHALCFFNMSQQSVDCEK